MQHVQELFRKCAKCVQQVFKLCSGGVQQVSNEVFKSWSFSKRFSGVFKECSRSSVGVKMFSRCVQEVFRKFLGGFQEVRNKLFKNCFDVVQDLSKGY